eukprot:g21310.t1
MLRVVLGEFVAGCITSPIVQSFEAASNNLDVGLNGQGLDIQEATDEIALHVKEIAIKNHTIVLKAGSTEVKPEAVTYSIKELWMNYAVMGSAHAICD